MSIACTLPPKAERWVRSIINRIHSCDNRRRVGDRSAHVPSLVLEKLDFLFSTPCVNEVSTPTRKCRFSAKRNVIFRRSAQSCIQPLYTLHLPA